MTEQRERRGVFGEATGSYETGRPGYPPPLVTDVLEYAALDGARALEVGAGTGKATVAFAARGTAVTCVEPDARMAEVLARNVAPWPDVDIVVSGLEDYAALDNQYGLVYAAQSWHWVDPDRRWHLAHRALRPGGALALFWNANAIPAGPLRDDLLAAHDRHDAIHAGQSTLVTVPAARTKEDEPPAGALPPADLFTDVVLPPRYHHEHVFTAQTFVDYLDSISLYRLLGEEQRAALFGEVTEIVAGYGGSFAIDTATVLMMARRG